MYVCEFCHFLNLLFDFIFLRNCVMLSSTLKNKNVFNFNHLVIWNLKNVEEGIHL